VTRWPSRRNQLLDLDGRNPHPYVPPAPPAQPREKKTVTVTTRPPRPIHVAEDLIERARLAIGAKPREVVNVVDDPAGLIITTHDGNRTIVVPDDRPDALGQTGPLYYPTPGRDAPRSVRVYADPDAPVTVLDRGEAWTVADLEVAASKVVIPAKIGGRGGPSWMPWIDGDPVKAYAAWKLAARTHQGNLRAAAHYGGEAGEYRRIVLESDLLDEREAAKL